MRGCLQPTTLRGSENVNPQIGVVAHRNNFTGRFSVRCDDGFYAVFKLMAPQNLALGDQLFWADYGVPTRQGFRTVLDNQSKGVTAIHVCEGHFRLSRDSAEAFVAKTLQRSDLTAAAVPS